MSKQIFLPKIAFCCGQRYEPDWLVQDWKENTHWADFHIVIDDRDRDPEEKWDNEAERYRKYRQLAVEAGADWVFVTAPDERLAPDAENIMRNAILRPIPKKIYFNFRILELYTPTAYRIDSHWATHHHARMYPIMENQKIGNGTLHANPVPVFPRLKPRIMGTPIYHLKHIEPENRKVRAQIFNELDPGGQLGGLKQSYEYLDDEEGLELKEIEPEKLFSPPYRKPYHFEV